MQKHKYPVVVVKERSDITHFVVESGHKLYEFEDDGIPSIAFKTYGGKILDTFQTCVVPEGEWEELLRELKYQHNIYADLIEKVQATIDRCTKWMHKNAYNFESGLVIGHKITRDYEVAVKRMEELLIRNTILEASIDNIDEALDELN